MIWIRSGNERFFRGSLQFGPKFWLLVSLKRLPTQYNSSCDQLSVERPRICI